MTQEVVFWDRVGAVDEVEVRGIIAQDGGSVVDILDRGGLIRVVYTDSEGSRRYQRLTSKNPAGADNPDPLFIPGEPNWLHPQ